MWVKKLHKGNLAFTHIHEINMSLFFLHLLQPSCLWDSLRVSVNFHRYEKRARIKIQVHLTRLSSFVLTLETSPKKYFWCWLMQRITVGCSFIPFRLVKSSDAFQAIAGSDRQQTRCQVLRHDWQFVLIDTNPHMWFDYCNMWLTSTEKILLGCEEDTSITGFGSGSNLTPYIH